jgi:hypothetical protein
MAPPSPLRCFARSPTTCGTEGGISPWKSGFPVLFSGRDAFARLQLRIRKYGLMGNRIETFFGLIDDDEGREPTMPRPSVERRHPDCSRRRREVGAAGRRPATEMPQAWPVR